MEKRLPVYSVVYQVLYKVFKMPSVPPATPQLSPKSFSADLELGKFPDMKPPNSPSLWQKAIAEFLGTYILLFIGCGSAFIDQKNNITIVGIALAWGVVITAMVYTFGHISGAHLNPAVTLAFATGHGFPLKQIPVYVISQLLGAILSSISLRGLFKETSPGVMLTLPNSLQNDLNVIAWEIIISFILMLVICGAASDHRAPNELCGVAIGAAIFINVLIAGKVSGASMNPARSIGPAIAAKNYKKLWMYIVSPIIGTVAASSVYKLLRESQDTKNKIENKNEA